MDGIAARRRALFSGAPFSSALFFNGDATKGQGANFSYFSGCDAEGAYLVLKRNAGIVLTNEMSYSQAKEQAGYPVKLMPKKQQDAIKLLRRACGGGKIAFVPREMNAGKYLALRKKAKLSLVDGSAKADSVRGRKDSEEVRAIAASARIAREILEGLDPWEHESEEKLAGRLKIAALEAGAEIAFEPIVATGANSAIPHHKPTAKKLGDFVLVDFGVKRNGYCSDFTRCYFKGGAKAGKEKAAYRRCELVYDRLVDGLPSCRTGSDIAKLADSLVHAANLPKMIHAIGHGVGLEVHEYPHLGEKSRDSLDGAVLALEPAAYFPKKFGVRYEGMVANVKGKWKGI